ncbi:MarR family winged helix-turn-helix transcriptional regulator [Rubrimonas cliftonensis]|uniref:DNA-binding transcriptional regulator, MarR family n=1 Tax=Rubrimonas cliftonensis TaxID=89524 RepID=A0A1H3YQ41_9RHOB|nr:MarR family transcriptional regulator [Rubrimonas cliftonensis]SEA13144.1 DNA-binding transcriptional regulator, MarR family [Rubrimonas cliftonensis]
MGDAVFPTRRPPARQDARLGGPQREGLRGEHLLYLTDEQLRQGIELMFFAYRDFTADPDRILEEFGYGRAHHRALHFVARRPGLTVQGLLDILRVTKQSLNRVLRQLIEDRMIESRVGAQDRRQRLLSLSAKGAALEARLSEAQRARMRRAFSEAGPQAVAGFRQVLERMIDAEAREAALGTPPDAGRDRDMGRDAGPGAASRPGREGGR